MLGGELVIMDRSCDAFDPVPAWHYGPTGFLAPVNG